MYLHVISYIKDQKKDHSRRWYHYYFISNKGTPPPPQKKNLNIAIKLTRPVIGETIGARKDAGKRTQVFKGT